MKKVSAIFLLIIFCAFSFTFKTHYCYYANTGKRFHGDCEQKIKEAAAKGDIFHNNLFPTHYICQDILKDALPKQTKIITVKNPFVSAFIFQPVLEISIPSRDFGMEWNTPEFHCRGVPLNLTNATRGSPCC